MKEIKFRLRLVSEIVGYEKWYVGDGSDSKWLYKKVGDTVWRPDYIYHTRKDQHTGLEDKNKKEIYAGDIIIWEHLYAGMEGPGIVKLKGEVDITGGYYCGFWVEEKQGWFSPWSMMKQNSIEIIGNKFDNPELMEKISE